MSPKRAVLVIASPSDLAHRYEAPPVLDYVTVTARISLHIAAVGKDCHLSPTTRLQTHPTAFAPEPPVYPERLHLYTLYTLHLPVKGTRLRSYLEILFADVHMVSAPESVVAQAGCTAARAQAAKLGSNGRHGRTTAPRPTDAALGNRRRPVTGVP